MQLRDFQVPMANKMLACAQRRVPGVIVQLLTGGGKTQLAASVTRTLLSHGWRGAFVVHRVELLEQAVAALADWGVPFGVVAPGQELSGAPIHVVSIDTALRRMDRVGPWLESLDFCFVDECFPAGTMVDGVPIESVKVGDTVTSFNHATGAMERRRVTRTFVSRPSEMVRVFFESGAVLTCTASHPVFTIDGGYRAAGNLSKADQVVSTRAVHALRGGCPNGEQDEAGRMEISREGLLLAGLLDATPARIVVGTDAADQPAGPRPSLGADVEEQPDVDARGPGEGIGFSQGHQPPPQSAGRERPADPRSTKDARGCVVPSRCGTGTGDTNRAAERQRLSALLQGRYRAAGGIGGDRGGRRQSQLTGATPDGREEVGVLNVDRVDRVEVYEPGSDGRFGGLLRDGRVYNIEVEGNHNYFAEGILVHNCHHASAPKYVRFTDWLGRAVVFGLTATPWRHDGKSLGPRFVEAIRGPGWQQMIGAGWISPFRVFAPPPVIDGLSAAVPVKMGEYSQAVQERLLDTAEVRAAMVRYYARYSPGRPALVACSGVAAAQHAAAELCAAGWRAKAVWGDMPGAERRAILRKGGELATGATQIVTFADLIGEGVDIVRCSALYWLRLTRSTALYLQCNGRTSRPVWGGGIDPNAATAEQRVAAIAAGEKPFATIIDLVGNTREHGAPDEDRPWTLHGGTKGLERVVRPTKRCTRCWCVHPIKDTDGAEVKRCPACRHVYPVVAPQDLRKARPPVFIPRRVYPMARGSRW